MKLTFTQNTIWCEYYGTIYEKPMSHARRYMGAQSTAGVGVSELAAGGVWQCGPYRYALTREALEAAQ
jgi:hypothetical protein